MPFANLPSSAARSHPRAMAPFFSLALLVVFGGMLERANARGEAPPPDSFASEWISYQPGAGVPLSFQNPSAALGEPTRFSGIGIDPGVVSPFQPAFMPSEIVSIGPGGSLVLAFDRDVVDDPSNPFGVDLIVFGNSFFADIAFPEAICGVLYAEGGIIDVSTDGVEWHTIPGVVADGMLPTLGFLDSAPYDSTPGVVESDFTRPVDPSMALEIEEGTSFEQLLAIYDGAGGGAGVDLATVGLQKVRFVRLRVPPGWCCTVEVDAVSIVAGVTTPFDASDLDQNGTVNGADLAIVLGNWGGPGVLRNGMTADLNGSGAVDGADLAVVLGSWS